MTTPIRKICGSLYSNFIFICLPTSLACKIPKISNILKVISLVARTVCNENRIQIICMVIDLILCVISIYVFW